MYQNLLGLINLFLVKMPKDKQVSKRRAYRSKRSRMYKVPALREVMFKLEVPVWFSVAVGATGIVVTVGTAAVGYTSSQNFITYYGVLTSSPTFNTMFNAYDEVNLLGIGIDLTGQDTTGIFAASNSTTLYFANYPDVSSNNLNFDPVEADDHLALECFAASPRSYGRKYWRFPAITCANPQFSLGRYCRIGGITSATTGVTGQISFSENYTCAQANKTSTKTIAQGTVYIYAKFRKQHN